MAYTITEFFALVPLLLEGMDISPQWDYITGLYDVWWIYRIVYCPVAKSWGQRMCLQYKIRSKDHRKWLKKFRCRNSNAVWSMGNICLKLEWQSLKMWLLNSNYSEFFWYYVHQQASIFVKADEGKEVPIYLAVEHTPWGKLSQCSRKKLLRFQGQARFRNLMWQNRILLAHDEVVSPTCPLAMNRSGSEVHQRQDHQLLLLDHHTKEGTSLCLPITGLITENLGTYNFWLWGTNTLYLSLVEVAFLPLRDHICDISDNIKITKVEIITLTH